MRRIFAQVIIFCKYHTNLGRRVLFFENVKPKLISRFYFFENVKRKLVLKLRPRGGGKNNLVVAKKYIVCVTGLRLGNHETTGLEENQKRCKLSIPQRFYFTRTGTRFLIGKKSGGGARLYRGM